MFNINKIPTWQRKYFLTVILGVPILIVLILKGIIDITKHLGILIFTIVIIVGIYLLLNFRH